MSLRRVLFEMVHFWTQQRLGYNNDYNDPTPGEIARLYLRRTGQRWGLIPLDPPPPPPEPYSPYPRIRGVVVRATELDADGNPVGDSIPITGQGWVSLTITPEPDDPEGSTPNAEDPQPVHP